MSRATRNLHGIAGKARELPLDSRAGQLRAHRLGGTRGPEGLRLGRVERSPLQFQSLLL